LQDERNDHKQKDQRKTDKNNRTRQGKPVLIQEKLILIKMNCGYDENHTAAGKHAHDKGR
jgi:hypothetical protein